MTDAQVVAVAIVVAPGLVLGALAIVRGYHLIIRLHRPSKADRYGHPHDDHHEED